MSGRRWWQRLIRTRWIRPAGGSGPRPVEQLSPPVLGRESGYVLALTSVALLPLVAVTALSVDLAVWQAEGADLQRAADAAVLAAVPGLPSVADATSRARAASAANGVVHGVEGVRVEVEAIGRSSVRVSITNPAAPRVFSLPFLGSFAMERSAVGEWARPVALGSPRNFLGTGSLAGDEDPYRGLPGVSRSAAEGYWLGINGPCAGGEQGDLLTAVSEANFVSPNPPTGQRPWRGCTSSADPAVVMVRPEGPAPHQVVIRVPETYVGGPFTVQVFDAAHCATSPMDNGAQRDPFTTRFSLREPAAPGVTVGDRGVLHEARLLTGTRCGEEAAAVRGYECGAGSWAQRWCNLGGVAEPRPGAEYLLVVEAGPVWSTAQHGFNGYGVRVMPGSPRATGSFTPCSTDAHDVVAYRPTSCIAVEGRDWLSVTTSGGGELASFSLAEVGAEHAGATMEVLLFDIGEGSESLELLDPSGAVAGFSWEVLLKPGDVPPTGGVSGVVPPGGSLDVGGVSSAGTIPACGGGHPQRGPGRLSGWKYNDRLLRLSLRLPTDPAALWGGRQWWRVRYRACDTRLPSDRTTWAVWIDGQPVRLVG